MENAPQQTASPNNPPRATTPAYKNNAGKPLSFFMTVIATLTALILSSVLLFFFVILLVGAMAAAGDDKEVKIKDNSLLVLDLSAEITERKTDDPFEALSTVFGGERPSIGLTGMLHAIRTAAKDNKVKGILIRLNSFGGGMATAQSVRAALADFRKSGKFIYAHGEMFSEKAYYVASVADSIFLYPRGYMEWNGLASNPMFIRGALDKLGVKPLLFRVGKFKSAGEMFTEKQMSDANRDQTTTLLNDGWNQMLADIATSRKLSTQQLDKLAAELTIDDAQSAKNAGLVDGLLYEDQLLDLLRRKTGIEKDDKIREVKLSKYITYAKKQQKTSDNKIAVIYAVGEIKEGKGDDETIGSETLAKAIREARNDDKIKAIVLRVNSPGGSALASDVIWREVTLAKKQKPVIASMGDVAASGGYYISAHCDKIVAQPTTITGSIGVFGLLMNAKQLLNEKLGITFDRAYSSNDQYADLGNPTRDMNEFEAKKIQSAVNRIYGDFISVVKEGRSFPDSIAVDSIAQGRVWSGIQAKRLKLVDELGGLETAVAIAAKKAGLGDEYATVDYPAAKTPIEKILEELSGNVQSKIAARYLTREQLQLVRTIESLKATGSVYMHLMQVPTFD